MSLWYFDKLFDREEITIFVFYDYFIPLHSKTQSKNQKLWQEK